MPVTEKEYTAIRCWKSGASEPVRCPENTTACYASWIEKNGTISIKNQNCFQFEVDGATSNRCVGSICKSYTAKSHRNGVTHTCCCKADLCNHDVYSGNMNTGFPPNHTDVLPSSSSSKNKLELDSSKPQLLPVLIIVVCVILATVYYVRRHFARGTKCSSSETKNSDVEISPELPLTEVIHSPERNDLYEGRFGKIYVAQLNSESCSNICIKEFYSTTAQGQNLCKNEELCHNILRSSSHKNIVKYYGRVTLPNANKGISMEYCALGSLRGYLRRNVLDLSTCLGFLLDITEAISYLHTPERSESLRAIAHRDVTSGNFLLRENFTVVICDFGLSRLFWKTNAENYTQAANAVGTPIYMAPEILSGTINLHQYESAIKRADVYSTALVMWEVVSRCKDFYGNDVEVPMFMLPYEAEMKNGQNLYDIVVTQQSRPKIKFPIRTVFKSDSIRSSNSDDSGTVIDYDPLSCKKDGPNKEVKYENIKTKKREGGGVVEKNLFGNQDGLRDDEFTKAMATFKKCNVIYRTIQESWDSVEETRLTAATMRDRIRRCFTN